MCPKSHGQQREVLGPELDGWLWSGPGAQRGEAAGSRSCCWDPNPSQAPEPTGREFGGAGSESPTSSMSVRKRSTLVLPHSKIPKAKIYQANFPLRRAGGGNAHPPFPLAPLHPTPSGVAAQAASYWKA